MAEPIRVLAWADRNQVSLLQRAIDTGEISIEMIGSPDPGTANDLASGLNASKINDLRTALLDDTHDIAWIVARDVVNTDIRSAIRQASRPVVTSTLPTDPVLDLLAEPDHGMPARFVPMIRQSPGCLAATQLIEDFGRIECVHVSMTAGEQQTSPWSLLYDAMDVIHHFLGTPDEIFAAHAGPRPLQPDVTAGIAGHFSAAMRFPGHATASIVASDGGGSWDRRIVVLGAGGRLIIDDQTVEWTQPDGQRSGELQAADETGLDGAGRLVAHHLRRIFEGVEESEAPETTGRVLALCEAARVSCLTGQAEDPTHIATTMFH